MCAASRAPKETGTYSTTSRSTLHFLTSTALWTRTAMHTTRVLNRVTNVAPLDTFDGVFPVGDGHRGVHQLHGLLKLQGESHVVSHDACRKCVVHRDERRGSVLAMDGVSMLLLGGRRWEFNGKISGMQNADRYMHHRFDRQSLSHVMGRGPFRQARQRGDITVGAPEIVRCTSSCMWGLSARFSWTKHMLR